MKHRSHSNPGGSSGAAPAQDNGFWVDLPSATPENRVAGIYPATWFGEGAALSPERAAADLRAEQKRAEQAGRDAQEHSGQQTEQADPSAQEPPIRSSADSAHSAARALREEQRSGNTDPLGSWTGTPTGGGQPEQDADDL